MWAETTDGPLDDGLEESGGGKGVAETYALNMKREINCSDHR